MCDSPDLLDTVLAAFALIASPVLSRSITVVFFPILFVSFKVYFSSRRRVLPRCLPRAEVTEPRFLHRLILISFLFLLIKWIKMVKSFLSLFSCFLNRKWQFSLFVVKKRIVIIKKCTFDLGLFKSNTLETRDLIYY